MKTPPFCGTWMVERRDRMRPDMGLFAATVNCPDPLRVLCFIHGAKRGLLGETMAWLSDSGEEKSEKEAGSGLVGMRGFRFYNTQKHIYMCVYIYMVWDLKPWILWRLHGKPLLIHQTTNPNR